VPQLGFLAKSALYLVPLGDLGLFEKNKVDHSKYPDWLPLGHLTKSDWRFLVVSTASPHAVAMFDKRDGEIEIVWPSFDEFTNRAIAKTDKTPFDLFVKDLANVAKLVAKGAHADAIGILKPLIDALPIPPNIRFELDDKLARGYHLYATALRAAKNLAEARKAFVMASWFGHDAAKRRGEQAAYFDLLDMMSNDERDFPAVITYVLENRPGHYEPDEVTRFSLYLATAYLEIGDVVKAEAELREVVKKFEIKDVAKVNEARQAIEAYIAANRPNTAAATSFLPWLREKAYALSPEEAATARAWWKALPKGMRDKLLETISEEGDVAPSDTDLARCLDVTELRLDEDEAKFTSVEVFLPLTKLVDLRFYGQPDSIAELRKLPIGTDRDEHLEINGNMIVNFAWPRLVDRELWRAAVKRDKEGIDNALAAGAEIMSRDEDGRHALMMIERYTKKDIELCKHLIAKGADPWAGSHRYNGLIGFVEQAESDPAPIIKELEAAAKQAGIRHPDGDPYRELTFGRTSSNAAHFKPLEGLEYFHAGESLAAKWPADHHCQMQAPKRENTLYDFVRAGYDEMLVSEKVAEHLRGDSNIELLPVTLLDHAKKVREKYYYLNPLVIDCLVIDKCSAKWSDPDSVEEVAAFVIDPARVGTAAMFRTPYPNHKPTIITRELADKLKSFPEIEIKYLKR
jgi:hypothetical protein